MNRNTNTNMNTSIIMIDSRITNNTCWKRRRKSTSTSKRTSISRSTTLPPLLCYICIFIIIISTCISPCVGISMKSDNSRSFGVSFHLGRTAFLDRSYSHRQCEEDRNIYIQSKSNSNTLLIMGKGDGKKKRKKKSKMAPVEMPQPTAPPPPRVTNDINISVKRQIRWAKMNKEYQKSGTAFRQTKNVKRTAYRKSLDEEEIEQARIERKKRGQDVDWDVILNATASSPLVIVDGYNVIHKWPRLKKWMNKGMISKARETLIHDMEEMRALKGWRIEIVFDGYGRNVNNGAMLGDGPGGQSTRDKISKVDQEASKKVTDNGVRVVYSGAGMSADGYIESRCYEAKKVTEGKLTGSLIVATDDSLIRNAAVNGGALCMSSGRMVDELKALRKATLYRVEAAVAKANGHDARPAQLHGKIMPNTFLRGSGNVIIEDKRNKPKKSRKKEEGEKNRTLEEIKKGTKSVPSWAIVPPKDTGMGK